MSSFSNDLNWSGFSISNKNVAAICELSKSDVGTIASVFSFKMFITSSRVSAFSLSVVANFSLFKTDNKLLAYEVIVAKSSFERTSRLKCLVLTLSHVLNDGSPAQSGSRTLKMAHAPVTEDPVFVLTLTQT